MPVRDLTTKATRVQRGIVEYLEETLVEAKAGKLNGCTIIVTRDDGTSTFRSCVHDKILHLGALELEKLRLARMLDSKNEE